MTELVIDDTNFNEYFFSVKNHKPEPGQVLACFRAIAVFGPGDQKKDVIKLLKVDKAFQASQVMNKIHLAKIPDCYRICREMCEDLKKGMTEEEVNQKEYEFVLEAFYYTKKEYVPKNDPHWELITLRFNPEQGSFVSEISV